MPKMTLAEFQEWKASPDVVLLGGVGPDGEPRVVYMNQYTGEVRTPPTGAVWGDYGTDGTGKLVPGDTAEPKEG